MSISQLGQGVSRASALRNGRQALPRKAVDNYGKMHKATG